MNVLEEGRGRRGNVAAVASCLGVLAVCTLLWLAVVAVTVLVWRHA